MVAKPCFEQGRPVQLQLSNSLLAGVSTSSNLNFNTMNNSMVERTMIPPHQKSGGKADKFEGFHYSLHAYTGVIDYTLKPFLEATEVNR